MLTKDHRLLKLGKIISMLIAFYLASCIINLNKSWFDTLSLHWSVVFELHMWMKPVFRTVLSKSGFLRVFEALRNQGNLWINPRPRTTDLFRQFCGLKNKKYVAAVGDKGAIRMRAYPSRVHTVFLRFSNLVLTKNLSPSTATDLIRASLTKSAPDERVIFREHA